MGWWSTTCRPMAEGGKTRYDLISYQQQLGATTCCRTTTNATTLGKWRNNLKSWNQRLLRVATRCRSVELYTAAACEYILVLGLLFPYTGGTGSRTCPEHFRDTEPQVWWEPVGLGPGMLHVVGEH